METTKAMLVNVSVSLLAFRKYDKTATKAVADKFEVKENVGRYNKSTIDRIYLKPIETKAGQIRNFFYSNTYPYMDEGARLLATFNFTKFNTGLRNLINEFDTLANDFINNYPTYYEEAKNSRKTLFNPAEYPDPNNLSYLRSRFSVNVAILPIPETGKDLRLELQEDEKEELKQIMTENFKRSEANYTRALWTELHDAITHMVEKLSDPKSKFKNSLVNNIMEICEVLPKLNLNNDPELEKMAREVEHKLRVSPDVLRDNKLYRKTIATQAEGFLKDIETHI